MNTKQKVGVFIAAVLVVLLVIGHTPWTGYETASIGGALGGLYVEGKDWPVWEYQTHYPLVPWLGPLLNFSVAAIAVLGLAALWCVLFRDQPRQGRGDGDA